MDWKCCLAGSSKTAPRILIFSIVMGADHSFYVKTIYTHAHAFLKLNILAIGRVTRIKNEALIWSFKHPHHFASHQEFSFKKMTFFSQKIICQRFFLLSYYFHVLKRLFESALDLSNEKKKVMINSYALLFSSLKLQNCYKFLIHKWHAPLASNMSSSGQFL